MRRLSVRVPPHVRDQITSQVLHIAEDSIDNALAWESRLRAMIGAIGEFQGHAIDDEASRRASLAVRKVVFEGTYLLHYHVDESTAVVVIVNFRHGARLPRRGEP